MKKSIKTKLPHGYKLITSGNIQDGDLILSCFLGYCEWDTIAKKDENKQGFKSYHFFDNNGNGVNISNFKGVARRVKQIYNYQ